MNSTKDAADFLRKLGKLLLVLDTRDPDPLNYLQNQRLSAWKALLNGSTVAKSRTQKHVQRNARQFALKVKKVAGQHTLYLCMAEYSISGLPKIAYGGFYRALEEWTQSVQFPEPVTERISKFWNGSDSLWGEGQEQHSVPRTVSSEQNISGADVISAAGMVTRRRYSKYMTN